MDELFRALPKLITEFKDNADVREAVVFAAWRKVAGELLRKHTVPFHLFKKNLIVAVRDNTWKRHLETLSEQMIFKINYSLGDSLVRFIEFRIDEETVLRENKNSGNSMFTDEELIEIALEKVTPKLRHSADAIRDDNLRYQFLLAAGSCLARKEKMKKS